MTCVRAEDAVSPAAADDVAAALDGIGKSNGGGKRDDRHRMRQYRSQLEQEVDDPLKPCDLFLAML
ncbi:Ternary complex factor MIP1-like [Zea mays]|uniref:Ternary complex factor MIP1-like n=1 Tax=Zea mays TaxID=4577 RepID=A0A1D6H145_MAIZE|nr:Ternary complex factor MIP1-like [Zea mays]